MPDEITVKLITCAGCGTVCFYGENPCDYCGAELPLPAPEPVKGEDCEQLTPDEARELFSCYMAGGLRPPEIDPSHPLVTGAEKLGRMQSPDAPQPVEPEQGEGRSDEANGILNLREAPVGPGDEEQLEGLAYSVHRIAERIEDDYPYSSDRLREAASRLTQQEAALRDIRDEPVEGAPVEWIAWAREVAATTLSTQEADRG